MGDKAIPDFIYLGIEGSGRESGVNCSAEWAFSWRKFPKVLDSILVKGSDPAGEVPDEELFAPSGFIQCSFFKPLAHGTHYAHSVGKELESKTQPSCTQFNQFTSSLCGHQQRDPRTAEHLRRGKIWK